MAPSRSEFSTDDRGRIRVYVGYWLNANQKRVQRPFYFGTDPSEVHPRLARVTELWNWVVQQHNSPQSSRPGLLQEPVAVDDPPVWRPEVLCYANLFAKGEVQVVVPRVRGTNAEGGEWVEPEPHYATRIRNLASNFPMVYFVPEDAKAAAAGQQVLQVSLDTQLAKLGASTSNVLSARSELLHKALNDYLKHIPSESEQPTEDGPELTGSGVIRIECAERLKKHHKNVPLASLDFDGCQALINYWRNRPMTEERKGRTSRPMSKNYCKRHLEELKRLLQWLHRTKRFEWRKPDDFDGLKWKVRDLPEERTGIHTVGHVFHTLEELQLLYQHASDLERLLLLLGLNCSFRGSESGTLEERHLFLDGSHPNEKYLMTICKFQASPDDRFMLYSRNKSGVYGEYLLWPETLKAIRWGLERKRRICDKLGVHLPFVLVTKDGLPFYRRTGGNKNVSQIFNNKWAKLNERIHQDYPEFRKLPFGQLRKTATDLVRHHSTGEIASVFEMHGSPTKDDLLDLYSNRPFGGVFTALREVRATLEPVFASAPVTFTSPDEDET